MINIYIGGAGGSWRPHAIKRWLTPLVSLAAGLLWVDAALAQTNLALNKPIAASSELRAAKDAVDGASYSRWESTHGVSPSWLSVDLGAAANLSQVVIDWEAANPESYQIQGSNNNASWTTLASETGGSFGNRTDTVAVSGSYRYVRVYATNPSAGNGWGYSIFELKVYGGAASSSSSSSASSAGPVGYVPLFPANTEVVEQLQYREADGTLVTLMGMRPTERHARERGEPWLAPNEAAGRYFTYPPFYFQNRSFGLKIRDTIPAGGRNIRITMLINDGDFFGTTFSLFRNSSDPTVTEFGWALNYGFNNLKEGNQPLCHAGGNEDCYMDVDSYWNTGPNPHRPLVMGDRIELAPAPRLVEMSQSDNRARIDGGGSRYYSFEQLYVVGVGVRPWYGIQPNLDSAPVPDDALLGGETSISYNYSDEPFRVFQQMANNIGIQNTDRFLKGRRLFHTSFANGVHSEFPEQNPIFAEHGGQLGPRFNETRCIGCHIANGRSKAAQVGANLETLSVLTGASATLPDALYGFNIQQQASAANAANYAVKLQRYDIAPKFLSDGTRVDMHRPVYEFSGPQPQLYSVRQAPQVIGLGLLEAIPEAAILANVDANDSNGDGVRGRANLVKNPETGATHVGRFGWKASKASVRQQVGEALVQDMGVTSPVYPLRSCQKTDANCHQTGVATHISELELNRLSHYLQLIGVPAQRSLRSGYPAGMRVSPEHDVDPVAIARGKTLFENANCVACHKSSFQTGANHPFAELRSQTIRPYTDLLLHDMGPDLADSLPQEGAAASMWRTAPLWGLGSLKYVQSGSEAGDASQVRYLHDGRAHSLDEAILWHGGEATNSRLSYEALSAANRADLKAFLNSL